MEFEGGSEVMNLHIKDKTSKDKFRSRKHNLLVMIQYSSRNTWTTQLGKERNIERPKNSTHKDNKTAMLNNFKDRNS